MYRIAIAATAAAALLVTGGTALAQDGSGAALVSELFLTAEAEFGITAASRSTGRVAQGGVNTGTFSVPAGADFMLIGLCDEGCSDLDLVVRDASGAEVGRDVEDDDTPMVVVPSGPGGRYTFEVRMAACTSSCAWGVRAYSVGD